ncbi:MAG: helix-turn-helix transcriptional regulator [Pseudomonadota bacterium]
MAKEQEKKARTGWWQRISDANNDSHGSEAEKQIVPPFVKGILHEKQTADGFFDVLRSDPTFVSSVADQPEPSDYPTDKLGIKLTNVGLKKNLCAIRSYLEASYFLKTKPIARNASTVIFIRKVESDYLARGAMREFFELERNLLSWLSGIDYYVGQSGGIKSLELEDGEHEMLQYLIYSSHLSHDLKRIIPAFEWNFWIDLRVSRSEFEVLISEISRCFLYLQYLSNNIDSIRFFDKTNLGEDRRDEFRKYISELANEFFNEVRWRTVESDWTYEFVADILAWLGKDDLAPNPHEPNKLETEPRKLEPIFSASATPQEIGARIRAEREAKEWTQLELAQAMGLKTKKTVYLLESGHSDLKMSTVSGALAALGLERL